MDKNTLSAFGWIVVVVIIITILLAFVTPLGEVILDKINVIPDRLDDAAFGETAEADAHSHNYTSAVKQPADCTSAGIREFSCECGHSYTESIQAAGHDDILDVTVVCDSDDYYIVAQCSGTATCLNCGRTAEMTFEGDKYEVRGYVEGKCVEVWYKEGSTTP